LIFFEYLLKRLSGKFTSRDAGLAVIAKEDRRLPEEVNEPVKKAGQESGHQQVSPHPLSLQSHPLAFYTNMLIICFL
jgi:hypothetical protein